jgi:hypothetical protein
VQERSLDSFITVLCFAGHLTRQRSRLEAVNPSFLLKTKYIFDEIEAWIARVDYEELSSRSFQGPS